MEAQTNFHTVERAIWEMTEGANSGCCSVEHDEANESDSVWENALTTAELERAAFHSVQNWLFTNK